MSKLLAQLGEAEQELKIDQDKAASTVLQLFEAAVKENPARAFGAALTAIGYQNNSSDNKFAWAEAIHKHLNRVEPHRAMEASLKVAEALDHFFGFQVFDPDTQRERRVTGKLQSRAVEDIVRLATPKLAVSHWELTSRALESSQKFSNIDDKTQQLVKTQLAELSGLTPVRIQIHKHQAALLERTLA
jgi:hypothetical protein